MKAQMTTLFLTLATLIASTSQAQAKPIRTGIASFGGVMVRVTVDEDRGRLQLGESNLPATVTKTPNGPKMTATNRVGIMLGTETLVVQIYLAGGNGGNPQEYVCENARLQVARIADNGTITQIKNECVYLE